jgi:hypothetical protein
MYHALGLCLIIRVVRPSSAAGREDVQPAISRQAIDLCLSPSARRRSFSCGNFSVVWDS